MPRAQLVPCAFGLDRCDGQSTGHARFGRPLCQGCAEELDRLENVARSTAAATHGAVARCGLHLADGRDCALCAYERQRRQPGEAPDDRVHLAQRNAASPFTPEWRAAWWRRGT